MYSILADDICIHNDAYLDKAYKVLNPKLKLQDNSAGTLSFTIPMDSAGYEKAKRLSSVITVNENDEFLWEGRIIEEVVDFRNNRKVICEGELMYLNDTTQPPAEYHDYTVRQFLQVLLDEHNRKVEDEKKFVLGAVTVHDSNDSLYRYTNGESTWKCVKEKLIDRLGGHIRTRHVDGIRYLDYLAEYPNTNTQEVRFGVNLLDFSKNFDLTKLATVIMPRGARLEESPIEGLDAYTTVDSVNGGSIYVTSESAIKTYGWIEQVVDWDNVTEPENLLKKAKEYLNEVQFEDLVLELTAFDLKYLNPEMESIHILDLVRCVSEPHGMDKYFPVTQVEILLDNPSGSSYTFGENIKVSLTSNNKKVQDVIIKKIEELPSKESILKSAKDNAEAIINMATNGFITISKNKNGAEELYISDTKDYKTANRYWRWNLNGLGYFNKVRNEIKLAITMDGAIVADFITVGTMSADRVRTGILKSLNENTIWDLDEGTFIMKRGSINLGDGNFSVDDSGYLTSIRGKIGGFNINRVSIYNDSIKLDAEGIRITRDSKDIGRIGTSAMVGYETQRGIVFDLDSDGNFMSWSYRTNPDDDYSMILAYASKYTNGLTTNRLTIGDDIDGTGHTAYRLWLDPDSGGIVGGITGRLDFARITNVNPDGSFSYVNGCYLQYKRGCLVGGSW